MTPDVTKEHVWLQKLLGEWTYESKVDGTPEEGCQNFSGKETVRAIGTPWIMAEAQGDMPGGGKATSLMTLGFDPQKGRFTGTWIGSMMTNLWVYDGWLEGNVLTLEAEGPDMAKPGQTAKYRDIIELDSDDHRVQRSAMLGEDGNWQQFMTVEYRRTN